MMYNMSMDKRDHIEEQIRNPLNNSVIGYTSMRNSGNNKTYFIQISRTSRTSRSGYFEKYYIEDGDVGYFKKIMGEAEVDRAGKKMALKLARKEKLDAKLAKLARVANHGAISNGIIDLDIEEDDIEDDDE